jgi:hypothetical protein
MARRHEDHQPFDLAAFYGFQLFIYQSMVRSGAIVRVSVPGKVN